MYSQVYLHKTVCCFRGIAEKILTYFIKCGLFPSYQELLDEPKKIEEVDDFSFFSLVHKAANDTLFKLYKKTDCKEDVSFEGLQFLAKHLVWRERIPQAFYKSSFNSPQYLKILKKYDENDKNHELPSYIDSIQRYDTFLNKLKENEFKDEFDKICSKSGLASDSVIVKIEDDIKIPPVVKRKPSRQDEYTKDIILLPKEESDNTESPKSLADLISGSLMKVLRVFAPREIKEEIKYILESSYQAQPH
jgi:HD superfamily phosphohydrolase